MSTSVRTRRAATLAALAVAGSAFVAVPTAVAAPGDNGDIKIHSVGTPADDPRNEPKVCKFYLAAFNFDTIQQVAWTIQTQPLDPNGATRTGALTLVTGTGRSPDLSLPDGTYKLTWTFAGQQGAAKQKVFKVDCPTDPSAPPNGGPPAGGGGLARGDAFTPVAGAAGVGLAAVGGAVWLRSRRRSHGAAS
ncbi:hypothetical protein [Streptomyces sp. NPDC006610]|uniref:hypothetical protein n=1 Tax=Streptomyces sp. NPDC006610 TaxID=3154584 RepID=UPI0033A9AE5F